SINPLPPSWTHFCCSSDPFATGKCLNRYSYGHRNAALIFRTSTMFAFSASVARLPKKLPLAVGLAALCSAAVAHAAYPDKPITVVVSYPPGGTVHLVARLLGPELEKILGQTVIIENKGGAGGVIGRNYRSEER